MQFYSVNLIDINFKDVIIFHIFIGGCLFVCRVCQSVWQQFTLNTPDRRQSKTLLTIDKHRLKITRNSVSDCHLSSVGNSISNSFDLCSSIVLKFLIAAYSVC